MTDYLEELLRKAEELLEENEGEGALSPRGVKGTRLTPEREYVPEEEAERLSLARAREERKAAAPRIAGWKEEEKRLWEEKSRERTDFWGKEEKSLPFWENAVGRGAAYLLLGEAAGKTAAARFAPEEQETRGGGWDPLWEGKEGGRAAAFLPWRARAVQAAGAFRNEAGARRTGIWNEGETGRAETAENQGRGPALAAERQAQSAEGVDRQFQRDARRYDGAFFLY